MSDSFARQMRRRAKQERHRAERQQHRELYGNGPMRWLFHGTTGVLADSIQANGIRLGSDERCYVTDSQAVALAYATWSTGMVAGLPAPYGPPTTDVGRRVAASGQNIAVVFGIRLPADTPLHREDASPPPLPWQDSIVQGACYFLEEPIPAVAVGTWDLFRVPELADPDKLAALKRDGDLIARAFARSGYGMPNGPFARAIPEPNDLFHAVRDASPNTDSRHHGLKHWVGVAAVGERLLRAGCGADPAIVFAFSLLHDARYADGPTHGMRAALLARDLAYDGLLTFDERRLEVLCDALARHGDKEVSDDPTIGACWDADRLTLARLGITPDPGLLSTAAARELAPRAGMLVSRSVGVDWGRLVYRYHLAAAAGVAASDLREEAA